MFGIEIGEVLVILVVALLVFGPDRLPTMAKQAASFVRDLRTMVANARRDLSSSVGDLGIDEEDLRTLSDLRNPRSFVRKKVLDGADLGLDDLGLDDLGLDEPKNGKRTNGTSTKTRTGTSTKAARNGAATEKPADTDRRTPSVTSPVSSSSSSSASTPTTAEPGAEQAAEPAAESTVASSATQDDAAPAETPRFDPDAT